jgi:hypothetical protein
MFHVTPSSKIEDSWQRSNSLVIAAWKRSHLRMTDDRMCKDPACNCVSCKCVHCANIVKALRHIKDFQMRSNMTSHLSGVCPRLQRRLRTRANDGIRQARHRHTPHVPTKAATPPPKVTVEKECIEKDPV